MRHGKALLRHSDAGFRGRRDVQPHNNRLITRDTQVDTVSGFGNRRQQVIHADERNIKLYIPINDVENVSETKPFYYGKRELRLE